MSKENEHFSGSNSELVFVPSTSRDSRRHSFRLPLRVIHYSIGEEAVSKETKPLAQGTFPSRGPGTGGWGWGGRITERPGKDTSPWSQQTMGWGRPALPPSPFLLALAVI